MEVFEKKLTPSERRRHWIRVPAASLDCFPPGNESFYVGIGSERVKVKIDSKNRLLGLGLTYFRKLHLEAQGASVVVEKLSPEGYVIRKK